MLRTRPVPGVVDGGDVEVPITIGGRGKGRTSPRFFLLLRLSGRPTCRLIPLDLEPIDATSRVGVTGAGWCGVGRIGRIVRHRVVSAC